MQVTWAIEREKKEYCMSTAVIGGIVAVGIAILVIAISSGKKNISKD